jgi:hypothetical protein
MASASIPKNSGICDSTGLAIAPDGNLWIAEGGPAHVSVFTYTTTAFTYTDQLGVTWNSGDDNDHCHPGERCVRQRRLRTLRASRPDYRQQRRAVRGRLWGRVYKEARG